MTKLHWTLLDHIETVPDDKISSSVKELLLGEMFNPLNVSQMHFVAEVDMSQI